MRNALLYEECMIESSLLLVAQLRWPSQAERMSDRSLVKIVIGVSFFQTK